MELFGRVAFALVVLAVFCEFLRPVQLEGTAWEVALVFALGALYAILGVLGEEGLPARWRSKPLYVVVQTALATAIVFVTPLKGFSGLVTMPAASLVVLELSWPWATLGVLELFAAVVGAIWFSFGAQAALTSAPSYGIAFVFVVVFSLVTRQARESRQHAEQLSQELAAANEQLRQHAAEAGELATTRERNRIAREIHDGIGHYLTTINVQLEAARAVFTAQPAQAATALDQAARLSREALEDVRRSVGTLRADSTRPPLPETLRALAANLGLNATVRVQGAPRTLPANVEHALFRSAQEGLTNVCKHAAATAIDVALDFAQEQRIALTLADDGQGLPVGGHPTKGHGLQGLRERVELLGGMVRFGNRPEGGFTLRVELPTKELA
ncbi:integral membrane sensor signal transduction histidine kinase [Opitutus terrae PB90-1]|uniref:histidine kinase n=2 Tax=Opitutus terrae TaxID=107709 RepID=B1ZUT3_OPITP|nr:integral membrane sensor signal transduction histidine kinase [Opitutus terrae PB90-1]